jgi:hypothetical protein
MSVAGLYAKGSPSLRLNRRGKGSHRHWEAWKIVSPGGSPWTRFWRPFGAASYAHRRHIGTAQDNRSPVNAVLALACDQPISAVAAGSPRRVARRLPRAAWQWRAGRAPESASKLGRVSEAGNHFTRSPANWRRGRPSLDGGIGNRDPSLPRRSFRWTKSADDILAAVKLFCLKTLDIASAQTKIATTSESGH